MVPGCRVWWLRCCCLHRSCARWYRFARSSTVAWPGCRPRGYPPQRAPARAGCCSSLVVTQTIETLARTGVKTSASLFDASLLSDAHALIS
jgi:hypothetical protein